MVQGVSHNIRISKFFQFDTGNFLTHGVLLQQLKFFTWLAMPALKRHGLDLKTATSPFARTNHRHYGYSSSWNTNTVAQLSLVS